VRIYQSSLTSKTLSLLEEKRPDVAIHVLRSYLVDSPGTFEIILKKHLNIKSLAYDSGTWSISRNTHKHHIDAEIYGDFLEECAPGFCFYFGFDPVHGDEGTEDSIENQRYLESRGLTPVPVIQNLNLEVDYYINNKNKYPFVAIGSTGKKKLSELIRCTNIMYQAGIRVHWFGVGSLVKLSSAPVWSSDCSSFAQWVKNGMLIFYDNNAQKEVAIATREYGKSGNRNKNYIRTHYLFEKYSDWLFDNLSLNVEDVISDHSLKMLANSYYFYELEIKINEIHRSKGFTFNLL